MTQDEIRTEMLTAILQDGQPVTIRPEVLEAMATLCHLYYERGFESAIYLVNKEKKKKKRK